MLQSELPVVVGQLAARCYEARSHQPGRMHFYDVAVCMSAIELFRFRMAGDSITDVERSGLKELTVSPTSPGLELLTRILLASMELLGYSLPSLQSPIRVGSLELWDPELLAASREGGKGNSVYGVTLRDGAEAVLKITNEEEEVRSSYLSQVSCSVCL